jgi:hypothetical protein
MSAAEALRARLAGAMAEHERALNEAAQKCERLSAAKLALAAAQRDVDHAQRAFYVAALTVQETAVAAACTRTEWREFSDALAEQGAAIDALKADVAHEREKDRQAEAARRAEAAKWRGAMDRKLEQVGGRAMTAAGIAAAHDHHGD